MNRITNNTRGGYMKTIRCVVAAVLSAATVLSSSCIDAYALIRQDEGKEKDYSLKSVTGFESYDSKVFVYEHKRTGAKVEFIINDDPDRYFMLEFRTRPSDNKGTAHVFEHSAMNGSVKYPSRSLSSAVRSRSYVTYMNACTKDACTVYPIASLSEAQLLKFADYYSDLCFEPMILEDEDIFRSEAWRLSLDDVDGDVGINGTIYSEMKGAYTSDIAAARDSMGLLYKGCATSYMAGGIPQDILSLTYDEVKDFHERYYAPSNCIAYVYGDIEDQDAFLDLLDGYFDKFDRKIPEDEESQIPRQKGYVEMNYDFAYPVSSEDINTSDMAYSIDLGDISDEELEEMYAFARCCELDYSTPKMTLKTIFRGSDFGFSVIPDNGRVAFLITASSMYEDEAPAFRNAVVTVFSKIAENGIEEDELDYFRRRMETEAAMAREGDDAAINLLMSIANYESGGRGELFYVKMRDRVADMSWFDNDLIMQLAEKVASPDWSAMAVETKNAELYEENENELASMLASVSAKMSDKDRRELVEETARITAGAQDDPTEYLDEINVITVSDLSDEYPQREVTDETDKNGVRHITVHGGDKDIDVSRLYIDASAVPSDMLYYLALYVDIVNGCFVPAGDGNREDMPYKISSCTAQGQEISLVVSDTGDEYTPYVTVDHICSHDKAKEAFDLAYQRLFDSRFNDDEMIAKAVGSIGSVVGRNIANNPELIACYLSGADCAPGLKYYENTHYIEYYDFLKGLSETLATDPKKVRNNLAKVAKYINHRGGVTVACAINDSNEEEYRKAADGFTSKLKKGAVKAVSYELPKYEYPLAIVTDGGVASNAVSIGYDDESGKISDANTELALSMLTDVYVRPMTRDRFGAYTSSYITDHPAVSVFTGRDPNTAVTFETFSHIGEAWQKIRSEATQDEVDDYVIRMYARKSAQGGAVTSALSLIDDIVSGRGVDHRSRTLLQLKDMKVADLASYDELMTKLATEGRMATVGGGALVYASEDTYAQTIEPFAN